MAKLTSSESAAKKAQKHRGRNKATRTVVKGKLTQALKLIKDKDVAGAKEAVKSTEAAVDRAIKRNVYHRNAGARRKSRLAKKLNALNATVSQPAEASKK